MLYSEVAASPARLPESRNFLRFSCNDGAHDVECQFRSSDEASARTVWISGPALSCAVSAQRSTCSRVDRAYSKHLRYAEVAERCGSFRKAANLLALKQSNHIRRVRHLEEQRGVALFERTHYDLQLIENPTGTGRVAHFHEPPIRLMPGDTEPMQDSQTTVTPRPALTKFLRLSALTS
jgi:hypothetical protein